MTLIPPLSGSSREESRHVSLWLLPLHAGSSRRSLCSGSFHCSSHSGSSCCSLAPHTALSGFSRCLVHSLAPPPLLALGSVPSGSSHCSCGSSRRSRISQGHDQERRKRTCSTATCPVSEESMRVAFKSALRSRPRGFLFGFPGREASPPPGGRPLIRRPLSSHARACHMHARSTLFQYPQMHP